jgi:hypothetical protein
VSGKICLEVLYSLMNFLRWDFLHDAFLTRSIQELGFSPNWESSAHKGIDDFRSRGFLIVKHNGRLVIGFLPIPC